MNNSQLPIGLASDHAGFALKQIVRSYLQEREIPFIDFGCLSEERCDYPDFGHALGRAIDKGECVCGIAVCGSGEGISMTLNKHQGVRAALVWNEEIAKLARQHNDANVLVLPGRFMEEPQARACLDVFFSTPFEGGRHEGRVAKIPLSSGK